MKLRTGTDGERAERSAMKLPFSQWDVDAGRKFDKVLKTF